MRKMLDQITLDVQYSKAKNAFRRCISKEDNKFLSEEIDIPVSEIITKNESVKIIFSGNAKDRYTVETLLLLFTPSDEKIGYYCYNEDESEKAVDEYLVFE